MDRVGSRLSEVAWELCCKVITQFRWNGLRAGHWCERVGFKLSIFFGYHSCMGTVWCCKVITQFRWNGLRTAICKL